MKRTKTNEKWRWLTLSGLAEDNSDIYKVSNLGRVRSVDRLEVFRYGGTVRHRLRKGKLLRHSIVRGYKKVPIRGKAVAVHRLVALAFLGPPPFPKAVVRHRDDDPLNCRCSNLRWGSYQDNSDDMTSKGRQARGDTLGLLTTKQVRHIKRRLARGERPSKIALDFPHVSEGAIYDIRAGRSWSHVTLEEEKWII